MKFCHLLVALLIVSPLAHATSFDCKKASTFVEKTICASPALGKLDDALTDNYNAMLATNLGDGGASLKKEQRAWIAQRNKCTTDQCLIDLYRKRVDDVCDAPVVTGVHAACVQTSDISAGPATPSIQGALKPASAQVVGTVTDGSDPATGLGLKNT
ncbi:lysozyme inhibitor LprI family protein [Paraburkholderia fungorum]|uniref:lysozyme inhibitor LprI family protein n=1 Tax=Paraburkholderia fungorum TaxID=134537 RepID=UPI0038B92E7A